MDFGFKKPATCATAAALCLLPAAHLFALETTPTPLTFVAISETVTTMR